MTTPIGWPEAQRICDIPEVREALDKFAADAHDENMLAMVSAIMGHASTQGRAAGLEEERAIPEEVKKALDRMCKPLHDSVLSGATAAADAYCMEVIRNYIMRALSAPSSDAGKDDALELDAKRYQLLRRGQKWSVIDGIGNTLRGEEMDAAIDAAIAAQGEGKA